MDKLVRTYQDYQRELDSRGDVFVFRGEPKSDFIIIPSALRPEHIKNADIQMFRFVDEMKEVFGFEELTNIEIAQHFSLPTRMLDFSYSYDVALFFACKDSKGRYEDCDGKVYVFNKSKYNRILEKLNNNNKEITKNNKHLYEWLTKYVDRSTDTISGEGFVFPIFVDATRSFDRLLMQKGLFLLWGKDECCLEDICNKYDIDINSFIDVIIIDANSKKKILEELKAKNISEDTLFMNINKIKNLVTDIKTDSKAELLKEEKISETK